MTLTAMKRDFCIKCKDGPDIYKVILNTNKTLANSVSVSAPICY